MARPPARAGGRSGLLTVGKHGKSKGYSPPSPKGYPLTSPARPAGGRAVTSVTTRGPQARYPVRSTAFPPRTHQRRGSRGRNLLPRGFFPPFLPKKWGSGWASQGSHCLTNQKVKQNTPQQKGEKGQVSLSIKGQRHHQQKPLGQTPMAPPVQQPPPCHRHRQQGKKKCVGLK